MWNAKTRRMTMVTSGDDNLLCTSSLLDPNIRLSKSLRFVPPHAPLHDRFYVWCNCDGSAFSICPESCRNLVPWVSAPYDMPQGLIIHYCVNLFHVHGLLGQLLVLYLSLQYNFALYVCTLGFEWRDVPMHSITQNVALVLMHYVLLYCVVDCTGHSAFHMYYIRIPLEHK